jgi:hypothetical protein
MTSGRLNALTGLIRLQHQTKYLARFTVLSRGNECDSLPLFRFTSVIYRLLTQLNIKESIDVTT